MSKKKAPVKKNGAGRPTAYREEYCQQLITHRAQGHSFESFGSVIGVCRKTLYDWEKANPEFLHAKKMAKESNLATLEKIGLALMTGKIQGNVAAWIFFMKNQQGWNDQGNTEDDTIDELIFSDEV